MVVVEYEDGVDWPRKRGHGDDVSDEGRGEGGGHAS